MIAKISLTQSEIANEINLKLDLAEHTLNSVAVQIPENFGEAVTHLYDMSCETRKYQEKLFHDMEQINQGIHQITLRLKDIERAIGADLCGDSS